jgi:hypothetical protein
MHTRIKAQERHRHGVEKTLAMFVGAFAEEGALEASRLPMKKSRVPSGDGVSGILPPDDSPRASLPAHPA